MGTALAIPIATEGLELDLKEGGWLCKGQEIVTEQTVRTGTLSAWGKTH